MGSSRFALSLEAAAVFLKELVALLLPLAHPQDAK